ncbi:MAG TPA: transglutaminase-like domain-containing protein [Gemmatimonadaceae bacterium]|nr:transglutaminase-like domain-containing protein [Gemmatimonadaceae bacterium]
MNTRNGFTKPRVLAALLVLLLWIGGLGFLVRREYFRPNTERLAEAALRVSPGAVYYAVMQGNRQIGFASSSIDTATTTISADDYLVADLPVGGRAHRASARTHVVLTRAMRTKAFVVSFEGDAAPIVARGRVLDDTLLILMLATGNDAPVDTQRIKLSGPILLPTLLPLAIALEEQPKIGRAYKLPVFDPVGLTPREVSLTIAAESSFVVDDSSALDRKAGIWRGLEPDTLRAYRVVTDTGAGAAGFTGWIDEQGRVVQTSQLGFELRRLPYEVAFENWRIALGKGTPPISEDRDMLQTTAIGANRRLDPGIASLSVTLRNADLRGFDLVSPRQRMHGDTLVVTREPPEWMTARYTLPDGGRRLMPELTVAEPLVQSTHPDIVRLAKRLSRGQHDPRIVAERINQWVYDSLTKRITFGIPSALQVLRARAGDCNEHAQLFVALARAAGIPARVDAGLAYIDGKFYYHAWPEVLLRDWVSVDPTFGEFPADAAHLRFTVGGLGRQAEMIRLMGRLKLNVVGAGAR